MFSFMYCFSRFQHIAHYKANDQNTVKTNLHKHGRTHARTHAHTHTHTHRVYRIA